MSWVNDANYERLSYKTHLNEYSRAMGGEGPNSDYFTRMAYSSHALSVWNESLELMNESLAAADQLKSTEAQYFIQYGLGRRSRAIWFSFRELYGLIHPSREVPLSLDDADRASEILNSIYIHIRGALDNVAWAFVGSLGGARKLRLKETQIGLFSREFRKIDRLKGLDIQLMCFDAWNNEEFKRFRDPAAHRVPLSVIPAILDKEDKQVYDAVHQQWMKMRLELSKAASENNHVAVEQLGREADVLWAQLQKIGKYMPLFEYASNCEPMSIYPTVPEDVGVYVRITRMALPILCRIDREGIV